MPNLDEALRQKEAGERALAARQQELINSEEHQKVSQQFGRYDRLQKNEDFKWLLDTEISKRITAERDGALDISKTALERSDHAQRHASLKAVVDFIESEHRRLLARLKDLSKP